MISYRNTQVFNLNDTETLKKKKKNNNLELDLLECIQYISLGATLRDRSLC